MMGSSSPIPTAASETSVALAQLDTNNQSSREFNLVSLVEHLQLLFWALNIISRTSISENFIHPYSFVYLGLDCRGNSLRRGSPDLPLPSHFLQLTWGTTEAFPGFPLRCTLFNVSWVYLRAHSIQNTILVRCPNHLFDDSLCYISHSLEKIHSQFPLFVSAIAFFKSLQRAYDHK